MMNELVFEVLDKNGLVITVDGELRCEENCIRKRNWSNSSAFTKWKYYDSTRYIKDHDGDVYLLEDIEDTHFEYDDEWYVRDNYSICECCGNIVDNDEIHKTEDTHEWLCEDCATECRDCGDWYRYSDDMQIYNDEYICERCYERNYTCCDRCGDVVGNDDTYRIDDRDEYWCESCRSNYAYWCSECGEYVSDGGYDGEADCCCNCAESKSGFHFISYSSHPAPIFYGAPNPKRGETHSDMGVGFELEIATKEGSARETGPKIADIVGDLCYYKKDCSCNNGDYIGEEIEIISNPMKYDYFMNEFPFKEVCQTALDGGYVSHDYTGDGDGSCGFHLHFSRGYFGDDWDTQVKNITKLIMFFAWCWDELKKASRRKDCMLNNWCKKNQSVGNLTRLELYKLCKKQAGNNYFSHDGRRYVAVNLTNEHTVEIRMCRGSLNPKALKAWADLMFAVVHNCCELPATQIFTDPQRYLKGITQETREYLNSRKAFIPGTYPEIR